MKNTNRNLLILFIFSAAFLFMGCPVSTSYPLGEKNAEKIDPALIGTWKNDSINAEAVRVTISKADNFTYDLLVNEKGSMYMSETIEFKAWITTLNEKKFLVLQEIKEGKAVETYYVYHLKVEGKTITTNDITLKAGGTDAVTSTAAYREEVKASMAKDGFLAGTLVWKKK